MLCIRRFDEVFSEIGQDWLLAVNHVAAGDEDRNRLPASRFLESRSVIALDGDLMGYVCEAELGEALAHAVRRRTPFGLPELERWS